LLKGLTYVPRVIITDKLKSYGATKQEMLPAVEHRQHRYLHNRAENSHQPTRQRERRMQGFKSAGQAQRFLATYGPIAQHFRPRRHLLPAPSTAKRWPNDSRFGRRSRARPSPRKDRAQDSPPTSTPGDSIGTHKLTMPAALFIHMKDLVVDNAVVISIVTQAGVLALSNALHGFDFSPYSGPLWRLAYWHREA
jgi:hypothetical protein